MEASSRRDDQLLTSFPVPLPSLENSGVDSWGVLKIPTFKLWGGFSDDQLPSRSPTRVTSLEQKNIATTREIPRDLGTPCQERRIETNIYIF